MCYIIFATSYKWLFDMLIRVSGDHFWIIFPPLRIYCLHPSLLERKINLFHIIYEFLDYNVFFLNFIFKLEVSEPKWVNFILNIIGVNWLRFRGLQFNHKRYYDVFILILIMKLSNFHPILLSNFWKKYAFFLQYKLILMW